MNRRDFTKLPALFGLSMRTHGNPQESPRALRIGALLLIEDDQVGRSRLAGFQQKLKDLGWTAGQNIQIDVRWAGDNATKREQYAVELVKTKPDVILTLGTAGVLAVMKETRTIPVIFVQVTDPVAAGFVRSLPSPGGNVTGLANFGPSIGGERLRFLKELAPQVRRALLLSEANYPALASQQRSTENEAAALGIQLVSMSVREVAQMESEVTEFARKPDGGLLIPQYPFFTTHRERIVALAERHRLPAVYAHTIFTEIGGLASIGVNLKDMWQGAAGFVDRILRGAKPSELPVQEPIKPDIVVNSKTARNLNLTIGPHLRSKITRLID